MGNRTSTSSIDQEIRDLLSQYDVIQEIPTENIMYLENKKNGKQYLLREMNYNDKNQFQKANQLLKKKKLQLEGCDHVAPLIKFITKSEDQFCSTFFKIYALFQYPQRTLDDEINQRNLQKRRFQQKDLWSILASCILGLSHLQKNNIKHTCLRSSSILLSYQGIIKIADPYTTSCQSNYDTLLSNRSTPHIYLSPQQTEALQQENYTPQDNPYKSDIWALGMIMLEAGLLQYQDECYRDQYSRVHWETLNYNINRFGQIYSQQLKQLIEYMLSRDERVRPEWSQLQKHVMKVQEGAKEQTLAKSNANVPKLSSPVFRGGNTINFQVPTNIPKNKTIANSSKVTIIQNHTKLSSQAQINSKRNLHNINHVEHSPVYQPPPIFRTLHPPTHQYQTVGNINVSNNYNNSNNSIGQIQFSPPRGGYIPIATSNIDQSRPFRNIFPNSIYVENTKIDQNLIMIEDEEPTQCQQIPEYNNQSQTYNPSISYVHNTQGQIIKRNHHCAEQQNLNYKKINEQKNYKNSTPLSLNQNNVDYRQRQLIKTETIQVSPQIQNNPQQISLNASNKQLQYKVQVFKMGSRYQGYKLNGMRHGKGKFYYQDGGMYDGQWNCNRMEGYGKLYYQSGQLAYEGQWIKDQFTGYGVLYNQTPDHLSTPFNYKNFDNLDQYWRKYQGEFLQDNKHGQGVLYLSNGQYFQGKFENDLVHGQGKYFTLSGKVVRGIWQNNKLIG